MAGSLLTHSMVRSLFPSPSMQYIDSEFTYKNFSIEEQNLILKAKRSNNELVCTLFLCATLAGVNHSSPDVGSFAGTEHNKVTIFVAGRQHSKRS